MKILKDFFAGFFFLVFVCFLILRICIAMPPGMYSLVSVLKSLAKMTFHVISRSEYS